MIKEFNNTIRLDLFKLHDSRDTTNNWILAKGKNLKKVLQQLIVKTDLSGTLLVKLLMNNLKISISTAEKLVYLKREWYPLVFIEELVNLTNSSKYEVQDKIEFLKSSKPPVVEYKAVKELTINLCKIVGAHAADGTMNDAFIAITDRHKSTIVALIGWFKEFGYTPQISQIGENEYGIRFHSRIFSRYLMKLFGFPSGCKQYTVQEPKIIQNLPLEFRRAFALGALTFEAGIGMKHQIEFCVSSKAFRDSMAEILQELHVCYTSMEKQSGGYWRFWSNTLAKEETSKWLELFETNTEKWFKLKEYINGYPKRVNSFEEALQILDSVYPEQSSSKIILKDVLLALRDLKQTYRYELANYLMRKNNLESYGGKWAHSLKYYLNILKTANIICVERKGFGKKKSFGTIIREVYTFNENIKEWRVPERNL